MEKMILEQAETLSWRRNTALFIISQAITLLGSSVVQMAIIWQVALQTSSGLWVTLLTLSATIPQTILSFFAGVWADRYPRKRLIILADLGIAAVTLTLALILFSGVNAGILPLLLVISALRSVGTGIQTPAVSAVIPQIVPEEHLMRYNGINGSMMSIVQFAAPAVAGAILYIGSFHWVLLIDVATAVIGMLILAFVKVPRAKQEKAKQKSAFFADLKEGISYAMQTHTVRRVLLTYGAFIFLCVPSGFLAVLMIERTFGDSYIYLTVNEMTGFAAMVLSGILLGVWGGFKNRYKTMLLGLVCYGVFSVAIGVVYTFWIFATLMFLYSFFIPVVQSSVTTILQESVPEYKLGRVFGLLSAMYSGFMPLGMAIFGPLADVVKIQYMVICCGIIIVLLGLCLGRKVKNMRIE
jgi:DHA3 family macrolide efflux protein-like MFS transporter